jgi:hypothetical protein
MPSRFRLHILNPSAIAIHLRKRTHTLAARRLMGSDAQGGLV